MPSDYASVFSRFDRDFKWPAKHLADRDKMIKEWCDKNRKIVLKQVDWRHVTQLRIKATVKLFSHVLVRLKEIWTRRDMLGISTIYRG
jgi:hypothetical protein